MSNVGVSLLDRTICWTTSLDDTYLKRHIADDLEVAMENQPYMWVS